MSPSVIVSDRLQEQRLSTYIRGRWKHQSHLILFLSSNTKSDSDAADEEEKDKVVNELKTELERVKTELESEKVLNLLYTFLILF